MAIETIGVKVVVEGADKAVRDLNRVNKSMASMGGQAAATTSPLGFLAGALGNVAQIAAGIISAQLISRLAEGLRDVASQAILGAGRVEELEIILELLGTRAGYTTTQLQEWRDAIKDAGIRTDVATELLSQFIRYQIDASEAVKLAAVAQDAATFAAQDSTEALAGLLHGILTQRSIVLRTYGIIVDMNDAYEAYGNIIGKAANELDANERVQAALNAVLAQGSSIAGAYAAAMETPSKVLRTLTGRLIPELVWALGGPFQQAFHDVVFTLSDFVKGLTVAVSEGGRLRPILDALAAAANRVLAPFLALGQVVGEWLGTTAAASAERVAGAVGELGKHVVEAASKVPGLTESFAEEAKKIADINRDLTKSITRMWDDFNRRLVQTTFDYNLERLRDELDWQRRRERDLAEHNRKMAELYLELEELRTGKRRQEIRAEMEAERDEYKDQRARFQALLEQARSDEERERIKGWLKTLDAEHKGNQDALQEEADAIDAEQALLEKRIAQEEAAFERRRQQEEEDRQIRLAREEEDFNRRIARDEEAVKLREALAREEATERIALVQQQMAEEREERRKALEEQTAMLTQAADEQKNILQSAANEGKTLVEQWKKNFEGLIPVLEESLIPALENLWGAWSTWYEEVWPLVKPILQFLADQILPVLAMETGKLTKMLAWQTVAVLLVKREWEKFKAMMYLVGTALGTLLSEAWKVASQFYDVGAGIVRGIVDGVHGMWDYLIGRVRDLAEAILYEIKVRLGIASPSKLFMGYGQDLVRGLAEGIRSMGDLPALQMGQVALGTLAAVPASTTNISQEYHLHTSSVAPVSTLHQDFHVMQTLAGYR